MAGNPTPQGATGQAPLVFGGFFKKRRIWWVIAVPLTMVIAVWLTNPFGSSQKSPEPPKQEQAKPKEQRFYPVTPGVPTISLTPQRVHVAPMEITAPATVGGEIVWSSPALKVPANHRGSYASENFCTNPTVREIRIRVRRGIEWVELVGGEAGNSWDEIQFASTSNRPVKVCVVFVSGGYTPSVCPYACK